MAPIRSTRSAATQFCLDSWSRSESNLDEHHGGSYKFAVVTTLLFQDAAMDPPFFRVDTMTGIHLARSKIIDWVLKQWAAALSVLFKTCLWRIVIPTAPSMTWLRYWLKPRHLCVVLVERIQSTCIHFVRITASGRCFNRKLFLKVASSASVPTIRIYEQWLIDVVDSPYLVSMNEEALQVRDYAMW